MLIGYARVSTNDQSLDLQLDALNQAGCRRVFTDKASGTQNNRPGLTEALSRLREGDVLVIWKLDRLGRTVKGLVDFVAELAERVALTKRAGRFYLWEPVKNDDYTRNFKPEGFDNENKARAYAKNRSRLAVVQGGKPEL